MPPRSDRRRLDSWKEIAAHLGRTVRTVQRWERDEGLPVHRHLHNKLGSVYAFTDEIDRWSRARAVAAEASSLAEPVLIGPGEREGDTGIWIDTSTDGGIVAEQTSPQPDAGASSEPLPRGTRPPPRPISPAVAAAALAVIGAIIAGLVFSPATRRDNREVPVSASTATDARALYWQGRLYWQQRTPKGFEQARHAFEDAIAAASTDARAHAGLADTYSLLEAFGLMSAAEALPKARTAAERAVQLDPNLGEAHASLAFVLWEQHDLTGAMAEMERALELDPDYATAHHWYGLFLQQFLRRNEAIAEVRRAVAIDPSQPVFWTELAGMLKFAGRLDEAKDVLGQALERHPGFPEIHVLLSDLAAERQNADEAISHLRRAVALGDNRPRIVAKLGCLEGTSGNPAGATEALHLLRELEASGQHVPDDALVALLAWTGDLEAAFRYIRRALDERQEWVAALFEAPGCLAPVRRDPRWSNVRAELERASWLPLGSRMPPREVQSAPKPGRSGNAGM